MLIVPLALLLVFIASPAWAYGGPAVVMTLLGSVFGFAGVIAGAIFFALLYPGIWLYRYCKTRRKKGADAGDSTPPSP